MKKSLLILGRGDTPYSDRNGVRLFEHAKQALSDVQLADYPEIRQLTDFKNDIINIMFLFPYTFWNANCETPADTLLYGTSAQVYEKFRNFFLEVKIELEQKFRGHRLHYVIPPENAAIDRDKIKTIKILSEHGIPTTDMIGYTSLEDITKNITAESGVFIKCRYGAEGKGITVLHHDRWVTNYGVDGNRLTNYGVNDIWPFTEITGRKDLLEQLLQNEVIVEREIRTLDIFNGKKFDTRGYVVGEDVPHFFVRLSSGVITNFSQGAEILHHPYTRLTAEQRAFIRDKARQAAKAMGSKFFGVDIMFDIKGNGKVVEVQTFTDFPDMRYFNLAQYMVSASGLFI